MSNRLRERAIKRIEDILTKPMAADNIKLLLVDTRILLETSGKARQFRTLKFYCDWVLHATMSGKTASRILQTVDEVWERWWTHKIQMPRDFETTIGYEIGFYGFEEELEAFLKYVGIDMVTAGNVPNWRTFESMYCDLVTDCLLRYCGKKPLKHIESARLELYNVAELPRSVDEKPEGFLPYGIKWTFMKGADDVFVFAVDFPKPEIAAKLPRDSSHLLVTRQRVQQIPTVPTP